jgi:hypothetical protein
LRNLREEDHLKDTGIHERIILKWIFKVLDGGYRVDRSVAG